MQTLLTNWLILYLFLTCSRSTAKHSLGNLTTASAANSMAISTTKSSISSARSSTNPTRNSTSTSPKSRYGIDCDPDRAVLADARYFFVATKSCKIVVNSRDPITKVEIETAENGNNLADAECLLVRPAFFPVSLDELGMIYRIRNHKAIYAIMQLNDWKKSQVFEPKAKSKPGIEFRLESINERSCHLHWKLKTIRCLYLKEDKKDPNKPLVIYYTDYEGNETEKIKFFKKANWTLPKEANIARRGKLQEVLAYYDEFTGTDKIWMEHNLQWLYNVDMDEQILRGNKTSRLTMYHLSNLELNRTNTFAIYSDSSGLVTAHCNDNHTDCRYIYNRIDAKSDMDSTCLLHLPYLTTVGVMTPPRRLALANLIPPEAQSQKEPMPVVKEDDPFTPIYVLVFLTFTLVFGTTIGHLLPTGTDELFALYNRFDDEFFALKQLLKEDRKEKAMKKERNKPK